MNLAYNTPLERSIANKKVHAKIYEEARKRLRLPTPRTAERAGDRKGARLERPIATDVSEEASEEASEESGLLSGRETRNHGEDGPS